MVQAGHELFHHEWKPGDPLSPDGDGLGPVFNAASCVACHNQSGSGGGGSLDHNVISFSVHQGNDKPREGVLHAGAIREEFREKLSDVQPGLPALSHSELSQHRLGRQGDAGFGGGRVAVSQVNTPALFGSGLIDALPDRVLIAEEASQRARWAIPAGEEQERLMRQRVQLAGMQAGPPPELPIGRVSRLADSRIGKFGWKGQTATLADFVQAACANELGLGNPNHPQPRSLHKPDYAPPGLDLTQQQCDQLTAYVASLKAPRERAPADLQGRIDAWEGKLLFSKIGCADCHAPKLGDIDGIYSDLLLHRMSDDMGGSGGYRGAIVAAAPANSNSPEAREWRTPPLWGVADSAPYMHDGRAGTLGEAIKLHGGQGERSATRFGELKEAERMQVLAFLRTLQAP
jgi:CxxC motif-containing protein (DUF1111 family)